MDEDMATWTRTWKHGQGNGNMDEDMATWSGHGNIDKDTRTWTRTGNGKWEAENGDPGDFP